ncbi:hypothetical protein GCM10009808_14160 [Microbacterium sediminicola]|uniref:non-specific serine/threonine protein kinase n=1 Tax=Microbacterium sediminicola TaxID=415210 RepID=A0ABN2I374_9MICO
MASRLPADAPVLAGFTYVRPLGAGGFADVFLYEQDMPRRPVAVKVLLDKLEDEGLRHLFAAEADAMARLSAHPSILTIYHAGVSPDGRPYIVMEYCPSSYASRYRREAIPVAEALHTGVKIACALESAHREGLLHRDIKPSNLLITAYDSPVLSDFGIAASRAHHDEYEVIAMSVPWSPPEMIDGRTPGTIATEVWGLGATIYSLLAGRSPFENPGGSANSREQLKVRIRRAAYAPIGRDDLPPGVEDVLRRALSREPGDRQTSAADFAHALQLVQYEAGMPVTPLELVDASPAPSTPRSAPNAAALRRTHVPHSSSRRARTAPVRRMPSDDLDAPQRAGRIPLWAWPVGGLAVAAVGVVAAVLVAVGN